MLKHKLKLNVYYGIVSSAINSDLNWMQSEGASEISKHLTTAKKYKHTRTHSQSIAAIEMQSVKRKRLLALASFCFMCFKYYTLYME